MWRAAWVCAAVSFTVAASLGAAAAALFVSVSCSVLMVVLNRSERSFSREPD